MITIDDIPESQLEFSAIRASGPGGQNVNKVSSAIHLRFDVRASDLPEFIKDRLLKMSDSRITSDGVVVIKAQTHRSQEKNREEALRRLGELLAEAQHVKKYRRPTRPSRSSVKKRLDTKKKQGTRKKMRGKVDDY
jgi:ribosome-associated protein